MQSHNDIVRAPLSRDQLSDPLVGWVHDHKLLLQDGEVVRLERRKPAVLLGTGAVVTLFGTTVPTMALAGRWASSSRTKLQRLREGSPKGVATFDADQFVADCRAAFAEDAIHKAVCEVLARTVSDPAAVLKGLAEPKRAEMRKLFHSDSLTILNVVWAPMMTVMPHNHRMWAVIGIYSGREDNFLAPSAGSA